MKDLQIFDSLSNTKMLYTDGRQPSEFTDSDFTGEINNCLINIEHPKAKTLATLKDAFLFSETL